MAISVGNTARKLVLLTVIAIVLVLLLAGAVSASDPTGSAPDAPTTTHRVVGGDTLWDIAAANTAGGGDVRKTVAAIRVASDLDGSIIHPGQVLVIPLSG